MTDATATLYDVTSFDGRAFLLGGCRRVFGGVVIGLGTVASGCALATTVTVAAAWIISAALSTNPYARAPIGPATLVLAKYDPGSAADVSAAVRVSTGHADAPDVSFEARWARTTASAPARAMPLVPRRPLERANNVASPPSEVAQIAHAPDLTHVARLAPAATPASPPAGGLSLPPTLTAESANGVPLPRPHAAKHAIARSPVGAAVPQVAAAEPPPASTSEQRVTPQRAPKSMSLPGPDSRTAVYDIAAHTVYLPNGEGLEAHSGLGNRLDDPRYVNLKNRGPTPPNVYDLVLREQLFHGVRAIRLKPVGDDSMFGRDGILAHSYMLGPNGQSNGCVSFRNYPTFLHAVLRGEVDRLVVVPKLGTRPSRTALASIGNVTPHNRQ